ncbi:MAG TPA: phospholipase D-like domain-containing protein [Thermoanaerobaculia bacterium]|nr:phospholipase D-like domain-containing protein [Thermoanaerobaculia bacterium]
MTKKIAEVKEKTPGRRTIEMELWLFLVLVAMTLVLVLALWSVTRGRAVRLTVRGVDSLREALPSIAGATHGTLLDGNRVEVLQDGDGFFPPLLADIAAAKETIHLESYVWWKGDICRRVAEALAERARAGVEVRVLLDASGSMKMDRDLLRLMRDAGCQVRKYRPPRPSNLGRMNRRDHRKIAVFDGRVGYVFGHGFAEEWTGHAQDREHWRDTGARLLGPIVGGLQAAFTENWTEETGEVLVGTKFFPPLAPAGHVQAHLAYYFDHGSVSSVDLLYRLAFASARRELWIQNPYLAPDSAMLELLGEAADRGVDVKVMLPGEITDAQVVRHAGHAWFDTLLAHGVEICEYQRTLNHQKIVIVDGVWSHIGSTNLDNRSFATNDEISLGIMDEDIAAELRAAFQRDMEACQPIELQEWRRRSALHKLRDWASYRINDQL